MSHPKGGEYAPANIIVSDSYCPLCFQAYSAWLGLAMTTPSYKSEGPGYLKLNCLAMGIVQLIGGLLLQL